MMVKSLLSFVKSLYNQPYLLLTVTSFCWGANAVAGRMSMGEISPMVVVFLRWVFVSTILVAIYHQQIRDSWSIIRPRLLQLALMGGIGFTCFNSFLYLAANNTTAINIGIIQGAVPVMVLIGMFLVFSARITLVQIIGTIITILGVIFLAARGNIQNLAELKISYGDGLMVIACVFYSAFTVSLKKRPPLSGMVLMTMLAIFACIASIPGMFFEMFSETIQWPTNKGWLIMVFITFFPSLLAQVCFLRGVELIGPARAGIFVNLVPIFAAILAVIVLGESFQIFHAISLVLVLGGIYVAERKSKSQSN